MESPQVEVQQGTLKGKLANTPLGKKYYSFEGIPYAKPPVGELRFKAPQEPENWSGVRDATRPGNRCAQMNPYAPKFVGSEDCLYLNVYTPHLPSEELAKLPVMFYVHGGRLVLGYGDYHRPDYFLEKDVVFVTINYRLHIFGYLALDIPEAPGNAGLKDTIMALKWVNRNICNFGGDSTNVTVMGESAGAAIAATFLLTKSAEGMFHKGIFESGTAISDLYMERDHIEKARRFVTLLGKEMTDPKEIYEFLLTVPTEELTETVCAAELDKEEINAFFLPIVEKPFDGIERVFVEYPFVSYRENRFRKVPILCGIHSHEGALFMPRDFDGKLVFRDDLEFFLPKYLFIDRSSDLAKKLGDKLKDFYFKGKEIGMDSLESYIDLLTDAYFLRDIYISFDFLSKSNKEVYSYRFSYNGNLNTRVMKSLGLAGASHGDIVAYQFYRENKANVVSEDDQKVVDFLSEVWTNFAKNGKPSWSGQKMGWLPYTHGERYLLNIDKELTQAIYPERERIEFWKDLVSPRSKM